MRRIMCFPVFIACIIIFINKSQAQVMGGLFKSGLDKSANGDYYGAIADFTKLIEQYPNEPKPYYFRAINMYNLKDYASAVKDFDRAISLNPKYAEAFYWRAMAKLGLKKKKEACPDFKKADELKFQPARAALDKYCR